jgi:hypothetical protein
MVFTFTLHYQLTSVESDMDALVERLAEKGCDDALVGVGQARRPGCPSKARNAAVSKFKRQCPR